MIRRLRQIRDFAAQARDIRLRALFPSENSRQYPYIVFKRLKHAVFPIDRQINDRCDLLQIREFAPQTPADENHVGLGRHQGFKVDFPQGT